MTIDDFLTGACAPFTESRRGCTPHMTRFAWELMGRPRRRAGPADNLDQTLDASWSTTPSVISHRTVTDHRANAGDPGGRPEQDPPVGGLPGRQRRPGVCADARSPERAVHICELRTGARLHPATRFLPGRFGSRCTRRFADDPLSSRLSRPNRAAPVHRSHRRRRSARRCRLLRLHDVGQHRPNGPTPGGNHRDRWDPTRCRARHGAPGDERRVRRHCAGPRGRSRVPRSARRPAIMVKAT